MKTKLLKLVNKKTKTKTRTKSRCKSRTKHRKIIQHGGGVLSYYLDPKIPIDIKGIYKDELKELVSINTGLSNAEKQYMAMQNATMKNTVRQNITYEKIFHTMRELIIKFHNNIYLNAEVNTTEKLNTIFKKDHYEFNIYNLLGVPYLSYLVGYTMYYSELVKRNIRTETEDGISTDITKEFNKFRWPIQSKDHNTHIIQNNTANMEKEIYNNTTKYLDFTICIDKNQKWNFFIKKNVNEASVNSGTSVKDTIKKKRGKYIYTNDNKNLQYKIHFMVDPKYILYVVFKLLKVLDMNFPDNEFLFKFFLNSRLSVITAADTLCFELSQNGGPAATIVLYSSDNADDTKDLLKILISAFESEADEKNGIGLMNYTKPFNTCVPIYNIRVNSLICYAHGDRGIKLNYVLKIRGEAAAASKATASKATASKATASKATDSKAFINEYSIPQWMHTMKINCAKKKEEVNRKSEYYVGEKICDIELNENCTDKNICFSTSTPENMLDPATLDYLPHPLKTLTLRRASPDVTTSATESKTKPKKSFSAKVFSFFGRKKTQRKEPNSDEDEV